MDDCCQFKVDKTYNANRGPTDKQPDETPFEANMRKQVESRVGPATSPQAGMADTMPNTAFVTKP
jgi:hypothetical protein